jgi:hypothetical protein
MDTAVDPAEVAKYRDMMRHGRSLPSMATVAPPAPTTAKRRKKNPQVAGRFEDMNAFVDVTMAGLTRVEVNTWLTMFRYVDSKKQTVSVSVRTVAERAGANVRHVHKAIKLLTEKGLLERVKKGGINSGASVYRVHPTVTP